MKLITTASLASRSIRRAVIAGKSGKDMLTQTTGGKVRTIGSMFALESLKNDNKFIGFFWNQAKRFSGFIFAGAAKFLTWTFSGIFNYLFSTATKIFTFNWNLTDKELNDKLKANQQSLAGTWGAFAGQSLGWIAGLAVGAGVSLAVPVIGGGALARLVASAVGREAIEEIGQGLALAIQRTVALGVDNISLSSYGALRRLIKSQDKGVLAKFIGDEAAAWVKDKWGLEGGIDYSMQAIGDRKIEEIKNPYLKAFIENLLDESWDSFVEAGFITAQTMDDSLAAARASREELIGNEKSFVIQLDRDNPAEYVSMTNVASKLAIPQVQGIVATHRIMKGKDVGIIAAQTLEESVKLGPQLRKLTIMFNSHDKPPFSRKKVAGTRAEIAIPDVKASVQWADVKAVAKPYTRGNQRVECTLDNGRSMSGYFVSESEGMEVLRALNTLSTAAIDETSWRTSTGSIAATTRKPTEKMFAVKVSLIHPRRNLGKNSGPIGKAVSLPLWQKDEPQEKLQPVIKPKPVTP